MRRNTDTRLRGCRALVLHLAIVIAAVPVAFAQDADESVQTEVIVLSTLHQLHEEVDGYGFSELSALIERLAPDVLAVELTESDLANRREQSVKQEYQRSVFPLLDKHDYEVVPLEPQQPLYDEIVGLVRAAQSALMDARPESAQAFSIYADSLYEMLMEDWTSPAAVNSTETDRLFESKHRFQNALFGPDEAAGWERWNRHLLERILDAAALHPGKRLVVLVGAEHAYWLREQLKGHDVLLRDTQALLDCNGTCD